LPDARNIADELAAKGVRLSLGGNLYDPAAPVGRLLFHVLGMGAEFEADLIRARTRAGMAIVRAKGRLHGKNPKLSPTQEAHLVSLHRAGVHRSGEFAELFGVARSTVCRELERVTRAPQCAAPDRLGALRSGISALHPLAGVVRPDYSSTKSWATS
jgi:DNA invertase Pin-like site-specific DNA recombinase